MVVIEHVVSLSKENKFFSNVTLFAISRKPASYFEEDGSNFGHDY